MAYNRGSHSSSVLIHDHDINSISTETQDCKTRKPHGIKGRKKKNVDWEILEGLKEGQRFEFETRKFEGYLLKKRKSPMKGWHKERTALRAVQSQTTSRLIRVDRVVWRFFLLDKSVLTHAKSAADLARGKKHGSIDIGMSVISTKASQLRIDIDADSNIYHLKCKSDELYLQWVEQLNQHRLHKQHEMLYSNHSKIDFKDIQADFVNHMDDEMIPPKRPSRQNTLTKKSLVSTDLENVRDLMLDSVDIEHLEKEVGNFQQLITVYNDIIMAHTQSTCALNVICNTPTKKKRNRFRLRRNRLAKSSEISTNQNGFRIVSTKQNDFAVSTDVLDFVYKPSFDSLKLDLTSYQSNLPDLKQLSSSNPNLSPVCQNKTDFPRPHSYTDANAAIISGTDSCKTFNKMASKIQENPVITVNDTDTVSLGTDDNSDTKLGEINSNKIVKKGKQVISQLNYAVKCLKLEREKARKFIESNQTICSNLETETLRKSLQDALQKNRELTSRLNKIHDDSRLPEFDFSSNVGTLLNRTLKRSASIKSESFSLSEYFDAKGESGSSSDASSEASSASDVSDDNTDTIRSVAETEEINAYGTGRRTRLPVPKPPSEDFSPFKFLYKNIGKDLSKVSMPVSINEPLSALQRLCEELEYSELLDRAASSLEAPARMVQVAAFAVSTYASTMHRAACKPFNPLLGETYECIREDKGFRFIAEQVTHHPPVSTSHAIGNNWILWQDLRVKTKFWGRSLEFIPSGTVSLHLTEYDEVYEWNKVTSCVHNLFGGGQRWVDQYGEMLITNKSKNITCRLNFVKSNTWTSKHNEVYGSVFDSNGDVIQNIFGKWTEALYCGHAPSAKVIWRPGSMPQDFEMYYGFTRFAMELNEILPDMKGLIPPTDSRLRPDQRMLEEGNLAGAQEMKQLLEHTQREKRREREEEGISHIPMWFRPHAGSSGEEKWVFGGEYWNKRDNPGFVNMSFDQIW